MRIEDVNYQIQSDQLHDFQEPGRLEDYGVYYNVHDHLVYFKRDIINEVSPGGYIELPTGQILYIPPGTNTQRFRKGAIAVKSKDGYYIEMELK